MDCRACGNRFIVEPAPDSTPLSDNTSKPPFAALAPIIDENGPDSPGSPLLRRPVTAASLCDIMGLCALVYGLIIGVSLIAARGPVAIADGILCAVYISFGCALLWCGTAILNESSGALITALVIAIVDSLLRLLSIAGLALLIWFRSALPIGVAMIATVNILFLGGSVALALSCGRHLLSGGIDPAPSPFSRLLHSQTLREHPRKSAVAGATLIVLLLLPWGSLAVYVMVLIFSRVPFVPASSPPFAPPAPHGTYWTGDARGTGGVDKIHAADLLYRLILNDIPPHPQWMNYCLVATQGHDLFQSGPGRPPDEIINDRRLPDVAPDGWLHFPNGAIRVAVDGSSIELARPDSRGRLQSVYRVTVKDRAAFARLQARFHHLAEEAGDISDEQARALFDQVVLDPADQQPLHAQLAYDRSIEVIGAAEKRWIERDGTITTDPPDVYRTATTARAQAAYDAEQARSRAGALHAWTINPPYRLQISPIAPSALLLLCIAGLLFSLRLLWAVRSPRDALQVELIKFARFVSVWRWLLPAALFWLIMVLACRISSGTFWSIILNPLVFLSMLFCALCFAAIAILFPRTFCARPKAGTRRDREVAKS